MCTVEKRGRVYLLTLTGAGEHRLDPTLLNSIRSSLSQIRSSAASSPPGAALVTTADGKFFSNGLDLAWARTSPSDRLPILSSLLQLTIVELLSLPMPTIAAVTGHAAAAGCGLALVHDHVFMRRERGFMYMSELDVGVVFSEYAGAVLRAKVTDGRALKDLVMTGKKVTADEAVRMGMVDRAVDGEKGTVDAAVAFAEELAGRGWDGEVYASIRRRVFPEMCRSMGLPEQEEEETMRVFSSKL